MSAHRGRTAFAAALALSGCASAASVAGMTVTALPDEPNPALTRSIAVGPVTGGKETNALWGTSQIDNPSFQAALAASLRAAGLLAEGVAPRHRLTAHLLSVNQPASGYDMTVTAVVEYQLVDAASGAVLLDEEIEGRYTARFGDAMAGVDRLRLATEGAARRNVAALIARLNALRLPPGPVGPPSG